MQIGITWRIIMTKLTKLALALVITGYSYAAQANDETATEDKKFAPKPFILFGYSFGGEDMGSLEYEDGSSSDVSAGGGFTMGAGIDLAIQPESIGLSKPVGVQLTGAYKFDSATADNADVTMDRFEFTILPYVNVNDQVRIGAGIAFHTGVEFTMEFDGSSTDSIEFDAATALVLELGFKQNEQLNWGLRFTSVDYAVSKANGRDVSGYGIEDTGASNFGAFMTYSFKP